MSLNYYQTKVYLHMYKIDYVIPFSSLLDSTHKNKDLQAYILTFIVLYVFTFQYLHIYVHI